MLPLGDILQTDEVTNHLPSGVPQRRHTQIIRPLIRSFTDRDLIVHFAGTPEPGDHVRILGEDFRQLLTEGQADRNGQQLLRRRIEIHDPVSMVEDDDAGGHAIHHGLACRRSEVQQIVPQQPQANAIALIVKPKGVRSR